MPDWTPGFLARTGLKFWLDASTQTGFADGATVTTFTGRTVSKNATAAAGEEPTYETNEQNSLPILRFDGVDNDMTIVAHGLTRPCTVALVAKKTGGSASGRLFQSTNLQANVSSSNWSMSGASGFTYGAADTNAHVHVLTFNGASSRGSLDGTATTGDDGGGTPSANMVLASTGSATFSALDLGEILGFAGTLVAEDLARLEGYLGHKWGITLANGHTYKDVAPIVTSSGFAGAF